MTWFFLHKFYEDILVSRSQMRKLVIKFIDIMSNSNKSILGLLIQCVNQIFELHESLLSQSLRLFNKIFQRVWKNTKIQSIFELLDTKISHRQFVRLIISFSLRPGIRKVQQSSYCEHYNWTIGDRDAVRIDLRTHTIFLIIHRYRSLSSVRYPRSHIEFAFA